MKLGHFLDKMAGAISVTQEEGSLIFGAAKPKKIALSGLTPRFDALRATGMGVQCSACVYARLEHPCGQDCGGPRFGRDFPKYSGPLSRDRFQDFCYVCGAPSVGAASSSTWTAMIGACSAHIDLIEGKHVEAGLIGP